MWHKIKTELNGGYVTLDSAPFSLRAVHSIVVPALCMGIVPHGVALETIAEVPIESIFMPINSMVWLVREPNTMVSHNLIIDQGPVMDGDIFTSVFNLSNSQLRIRKGEVVSRLVCIQGVTWRTA